MNTTKIFLEELAEALERAMERVVEQDADELSDILLAASNGNQAAKRAISQRFDRSDKVRELATLAEAAVHGIEESVRRKADTTPERLQYFLGMEFTTLAEALDAFMRRYPRSSITMDELRILSTRVCTK